MNKSYARRINNQLAGLAGIVMGIAILLLPVTVAAQTISDECAECHNSTYQEWKASGHPYKLMKGDIAQNRPIPLPKGYVWDDISYVIGGYKWKSRYMDKEGYIITQGLNEENDEAGNTQYNYLVGYWSDYHADEEDGTKPYNCGSCHTTGWVPNENPEDLSGNQDGLPGIHGTFQQGGVQCIQCHGGSKHADFGSIDASAEACGACHYRTAPPGAEVNVIPASGGWIKHHEQYNEFLAGPHADVMECTTCHDPHKRGEFSIKEGRDCTDCHTDQAESYALNPMASYGVECKDCHMPYATKNAQPTGPYAADLQTHIFYIDTDPEANMFTDDGTFVKLDDNGKAAVTLDFACKRCHLTGDMTELGNFAKNFHGDDTSVNELEYIGLNPGLSGNWSGGSDRSGEGFLIEVASSNDVLTLIGSFYTFDPEGNLLWLIAVGLADTGMTSDVTLYISSGQKWGADFDPAAKNTVVFGTGTFTFPACDVGMVSITPNTTYTDLGYGAISYDLSRDITTSLIACPSMYKD
jgi:hypothetical protein